MLFVMGIMLGMGVVSESGVLRDVAQWIDVAIGNIWVVGFLMGLLSSLVDSFTIAISGISLYQVDPSSADLALNGAYWKVVAYSTAVGGCLLSVGSTSGMALMQMEHIRLGWYFRNVAPKVLIGFLLGFAVLYAEIALFS